MNKRPLPVLLVGCVYLLTGAIGLVSRLIQFKPQPPFQYDIVWISLVSLAAIVAGAYLLQGCNWARWLATAWIAFHVVLSAFHSVSEFAIHTLLFFVFGYFLFRPSANRYFRPAISKTTESTQTSS
jgi:hypothetical protein